MRHKRLVKNRKLSWRGFAKKFWDGGSGWLLVFLIGVSSGILAGKRCLHDVVIIYVYQCHVLYPVKQGGKGIIALTKQEDTTLIQLTRVVPVVRMYYKLH